MSKIRNSTILITGGASGMGRLLAERCLKEKAFRVILWDINENALKRTVAELGEDTYGMVVNVADRESIENAAEELLSEHGPVDILFNNAGIVVGKDFVEHSYTEIEKTIAINVTGVMHVTRAFLPAMLEAEKGHIINIASAAGLIPNPKMSVYVASKWAVIGWSESLRLELEEAGPELKVTTVEPSYINTGMFDGVKAPLLTPMMEADFIVDKIIKAVKSNSIIVREPFMVKTIPMLRGILPTRTFDFMARSLGVYDGMESFVGHKSKS